jgi:hypothetical protein
MLNCKASAVTSLSLPFVLTPQIRDFPMAEKTSEKLRNILFWVGVPASGISIIFVLKSAGLQETGKALTGVDLTFAFLCFVFTMLHMLVRN